MSRNLLKPRNYILVFLPCSGNVNVGNLQFTSIQNGIGTGASSIIDPNNLTDLTVTYTGPLSGYISDPFYFEQFVVLDFDPPKPPVPPVPPVPPTPNAVTPYAIYQIDYQSTTYLNDELYWKHRIEEVNKSLDGFELMIYRDKIKMDATYIQYDSVNADKCNNINIISLSSAL